MIEINFSAEDIFIIRSLQAQHPHPFVRRKALVLMLKEQKTPHHEIVNIVGICENTVREYLQGYKIYGAEFIQQVNFNKPKSQLQSFDTEIKKYFEKNPPTTITQACHDVKKLTGISIKNTQMKNYLKNLGMKCRKVNSIPAKVNTVAQKEFHDKQLQPKLDEAKEGKRAVYFMDAAHFVMGAFLGYLWCFTRVFARTPCGRQRFNVLGALNAITKELQTVTNATYITSIQVCELLKKLAANTTLPITIVLDNARYQRCKMVIALAGELKIDLLFLPPYSPNLNLIERLWKFVKKECLYSIYYDSFSLFFY
jgi:transposase